ncbi:MAG: dihydrofolate reductase, partial [Muribaculaceae bacterium]|nr:dihydrofolate reductase [Muribaculaceae bacterium]
MITIIAAVTADRYAIGRRGDLVYHVSADLRRFKELTMGHAIVMGRKTFESLPKGALPGRRN